MPKMYNPDTQETVDVSGRDVQSRRSEGFLPVGNRPEAEYLGKTRDELTADDNTGDTGDTGDTGNTGETPA